MNEQLLKTSGTDVLSSRKISEKPYGGWLAPPPRRPLDVRGLIEFEIRGRYQNRN